jgi:hypothetical protein
MPLRQEKLEVKAKEPGCQVRRAFSSAVELPVASSRRALSLAVSCVSGPLE